MFPLGLPMTPGRIGARGRGYLVGTRISVGSIVERDMSALMCDVGGAYVQREWSYVCTFLIERTCSTNAAVVACFASISGLMCCIRDMPGRCWLAGWPQSS